MDTEPESEGRSRHPRKNLTPHKVTKAVRVEDGGFAVDPELVEVKNELPGDEVILGASPANRLNESYIMCLENMNSGESSTSGSPLQRRSGYSRSPRKGRPRKIIIPDRDLWQSGDSDMDDINDGAITQSGAQKQDVERDKKNRPAGTKSKSTRQTSIGKDCQTDKTLNLKGFSVVKSTRNARDVVTSIKATDKSMRRKALSLRVKGSRSLVETSESKMGKMTDSYIQTTIISPRKPTSTNLHGKAVGKSLPMDSHGNAPEVAGRCHTDDKSKPPDHRHRRASPRKVPSLLPESKHLGSSSQKGFSSKGTHMHQTDKTKGKKLTEPAKDSVLGSESLERDQAFVAKVTKLTPRKRKLSEVLEQAESNGQSQQVTANEQAGDEMTIVGNNDKTRAKPSKKQLSDGLNEPSRRKSKGKDPGSGKSSKASSRSSSARSSRCTSRVNSPVHGMDMPGPEQIKLLTEHLSTLGKDSEHLNTYIHHRASPRKKRKRNSNEKNVLPKVSTPVRRGLDALKAKSSASRVLAGSPAKRASLPGSSPRRSPRVAQRTLPAGRRTPLKAPRSSTAVTTGACSDPQTPSRSDSGLSTRGGMSKSPKTPIRHAARGSSTPGKALGSLNSGQSITQCRTPGSRGLARSNTPGRTPGRSPRRLLSPLRIKVKTPTRASAKRKLYAISTSPDKPCSQSDTERETNADLDYSSASLAIDMVDSPQQPKKASTAIDDAASSPNSGDDLHIADDDLDSMLEEKSQKIKLTTWNVRNIIHQVITNEDVLDMVRNTILEEDGLDDQLKEAIFQPKLTRSTLREVVEKHKIPMPWTFSPIKGAPEPKPVTAHFLEMSFSDTEEGDDEYQPTAEELEHVSDDESVYSSQASDLGSPMPGTSLLPSTPLTPQSVCSEPDTTPTGPCKILSKIAAATAPVNDMLATPVANTTMMRPPATVPLRCKTPLDSAKGAPVKVCMANSPQLQESTETIALRTRSRLSLNDTPLDVIESNFVAPDITADMYSTVVDDQEWKEFLNGLTKQDVRDLNDTADTIDNDTEDPEYNFLAEAEKEELDQEDFRDDRAVRVSQKELDILMDEVFESYGVAEFLDEEDDEETMSSLPKTPLPFTSVACVDRPAVSSAHEGCVMSPIVGPTEDRLYQDSYAHYPGHIPPLRLDPQLASILATHIVHIKQEAVVAKPAQPLTTDCIVDNAMPILSSEEIIQLQDQMRKHVQLLAQTHVQAVGKSHPQFADACNLAKGLLFELRLIASKNLLLRGQSHLYTPNLDGALEVIQHNYVAVDKDHEDALRDLILAKVMAQKAYDTLGLNYAQMSVFASDKAFIFPQMLPEMAFAPVDLMAKAKVRVTFTDAEDFLLVMGVDQFQHVNCGKYGQIQKFLLPCKTREQIRFRHKNLRSRSVENSVKYFYREGKLPVSPRYLMLEDPSDIVAPFQRDPELLPKWFPAYEACGDKFRGKPTLPCPLLPSALPLDLELLSRCSSPASSLASTDGGSVDTEGNSRKGRRKKREPRSTPSASKASKILPKPMLAVSGMSPAQIIQEIVQPTPPTESPPSSEVTKVTITAPRKQEAPCDQEMEDAVLRELMSALEAPPSCKLSHTDKSPAVTDHQMTKGGVELEVALPSLVAGESMVLKASPLPVVSFSNTQRGMSLSPHVVVTQVPEIAAVTPTQLKQLGLHLNKEGLAPKSPLVGLPEKLCLTHHNASTDPVAGKTSVVSVMQSHAGRNFPLITPASPFSGITGAVQGTAAAAGYNTNTVAIHSSSLISHAFAAATGIPVGDLQSTTDMHLLGETAEPDAAGPRRPRLAQVEQGAGTKHVIEALVHAEQGPGGLMANGEAAAKSAGDGDSSERHLSHAEIDAQDALAPDHPPPRDLLVDSQSESLPKPQLDIPVDPRQPTITVEEALWCEESISSMTSLRNLSPSNTSEPTPSSEEESPKKEPGPRRVGYKNIRMNHPPPGTVLEESQDSHVTHNYGSVESDYSYKLPPTAQRQPASLDESSLDSSSLPPECQPVTVTEVAVQGERAESSANPPDLISNLISQNSESQPESPVKSAIRFISELAQLARSPSRRLSPLKWCHQQRTPTKRSSMFLRSPVKSSFFHSPPKFIMPKKSAAGKSGSPARCVSPTLPRPTKSPRRKILQQQAKAILPKGFILKSVQVSPVKMAAASISARAKRTISQHRDDKPSVVRKLHTPASKEAGPSKESYDGTEQRRSSTSRDISDTDGDSLDMDYMTDEDRPLTRSGLRRRRMQRRSRQNSDNLREEDAGSASDDDGGGDSHTEEEDLDETVDDEDERLAELMAASTTIRFAPRRTGSGATSQLAKARQKQEALLEMLAPDIIERDPLLDERDTAFAQAYLSKVRHALADSPEQYERFVSLLSDFGHNDKSPVELYQDIKSLLTNHVDMVTDFAGFLKPDQAKECGCLMVNLEFTRARTFLRKIETYFKKNQAQLQKILKAFSQWQARRDSDARELNDAIRPLLKGQQHLLDEFMMFFPDGQPPESSRGDFEEVSLLDSDEELHFDGFEQLTMPDRVEDEMYATKYCPCKCHQSLNPTRAARRRHCAACALKCIKGQLYIHLSEKHIHPVEFEYRDNMPCRNSPRTPPAAADDNQDEDRDEANLTTAASSLKPKEEGDNNDDKAAERGQGDATDGGLLHDEPIENIPPPPRLQKNRKKRPNIKIKLCHGRVIPYGRPDRTRKSHHLRNGGRGTSTSQSALHFQGGTSQQADPVTGDDDPSGVTNDASVSRESLVLSPPEHLDGSTSQMAMQLESYKEEKFPLPTDFSALREEIRRSSSIPSALDTKYSHGDDDGTLPVCFTKATAVDSVAPEINRKEYDNDGVVSPPLAMPEPVEGIVSPPLAMPETEEGIVSPLLAMPETEEGIVSPPLAMPETEEGIVSPPLAMPETEEGIVSPPFAMPETEEGIVSPPLAMPETEEGIVSPPLAMPETEEGIVSPPLAMHETEEGIVSPPLAMPETEEGIVSPPLAMPETEEGIVSPPLAMHETEEGIVSPPLAMPETEEGIVSPPLAMHETEEGIVSPPLAIPETEEGIVSPPLAMPETEEGIVSPPLAMPETDEARSSSNDGKSSDDPADDSDLVSRHSHSLDGAPGPASASSCHPPSTPQRSPPKDDLDLDHDLDLDCTMEYSDSPKTGEQEQLDETGTTSDQEQPMRKSPSSVTGRIEQGGREAPAGEPDIQQQLEGDNMATCKWSREDDQVILETCKQEGLGPGAFQTAASVLVDKTLQQVSQRFMELMQMFVEEDSVSSEDATDTR